MNLKFQNIDLIDLINERQVIFKSILEERWGEVSDIPFSNSEWYIMTRIYKKQPTISYVTKHVHTSRQATHKLIKRLEAKGIVEIMKANHNNRDKCIKLTELGEECYEKIVDIKRELENQISQKIGEEKLLVLKEILGLDWGL